MAVLFQASFARAFGGDDHDWASSIVRTTDRGFAVAGSTWGFGSVWIDLLLIKISESGEPEWAKTIRGDGPEWCSGVFQSPDGGFAIAGHTRSFGAQGADLLLVKLLPDGDLEWARMIGGEGDNYARGAFQCADSGYVMTGGTRRGPKGWDAFLVKVSGTGELEWARSIDLGGLDCGECVIGTQDGGFAVAGWTMGWGAGYSDFLVARFSPDGSPEWIRAYGTTEHDAGHAIIQAPDAGFMVVGETWGAGAGRSDILLIKITSDGSLEWAMTYGGPGIDLASSLAGVPDGGCLISGQTNSFGVGEYDILLLKVSPSGVLEWARTFGGTNPDSIGQVIALADTGIAAVGSSGSWGAGLSDIIVLRLPADGSYPGCLIPCEPAASAANPSANAPAFLGGAADLSASAVNPALNPCSPSAADICPPAVEEHSGKPAQGVICYPGPGGAMFFSPADISLMVYAVDGRLAYSGELRRGRNRIRLETGVYFWRAGEQTGKIAIR